MNDSRGKYYVKKAGNLDTFSDICTLFDGVAVLKLTGLMDLGKPVNIYTEQFIDSQVEDFLITKKDENSNPIVIRENMDLSLTFCIRNKYAYLPPIDLISTHDAFINYMTRSDLWIKSEYLGGKNVHCVCLQAYKPTTIKLERGDNSYILGTITLHTLEATTTPTT